MFAFTVDWALVVQLVVAVILPILVGLVTNKITSSGTKAWLLALFTLLTSGFTELGRALASGTTFDIGMVLLTLIPSFAISVATHYGLWKPTSVAAKAQDALGGAAAVAYVPDEVPTVKVEVPPGVPEVDPAEYDFENYEEPASDVNSLPADLEPPAGFDDGSAK